MAKDFPVAAALPTAGFVFVHPANITIAAMTPAHSFFQVMLETGKHNACAVPYLKRIKNAFVENLERDYWRQDECV